MYVCVRVYRLCCVYFLKINRKDGNNKEVNKIAPKKKRKNQRARKNLSGIFPGKEDKSGKKRKNMKVQF